MEREIPDPTPRDPSAERTHTPGEAPPVIYEGAPEPEPADDEDRADRNPGAIRAEDTEPYIALQYVARLFKIAAMVVIVALIAEIVAGVLLEGAGALFPLMAELIRGVVLAAILWGAGDLTVLLIDVGHDVRAARVLLGRISARAASDQSRPGDGN